MKLARKLSKLAGGHASRDNSNGDMLAEDDEFGKPRTVLKKCDPNEFAVYTEVSALHKLDPACKFIPRFLGSVEIPEGETMCRYIRMENLLRGFCQPKVMDVKVGCRTFLESECSNPKPRPDLYKRMKELYPDELNFEDEKAKAITKYKWMTVRDAKTTIGTLGFRIEGIAGFSDLQKEDLDKELVTYASAEDCVGCFEFFALEAGPTPSSPRRDSSPPATREASHNELCWQVTQSLRSSAPSHNSADTLSKLTSAPSILSAGVRGRMVIKRLREQLHGLRRCLEVSEFVRRYEFIGTSFLLVADAEGNTGVYWIDFAKTHVVPPGMKLDHRSQWTPGNHEDGLLRALDNIIQCWENLATSLDIPLDSLESAQHIEVHDGRSSAPASHDGRSSAPVSHDGRSSMPVSRMQSATSSQASRVTSRSSMRISKLRKENSLSTEIQIADSVILSNLPVFASKIREEDAEGGVQSGPVAQSDRASKVRGVFGLNQATSQRRRWCRFLACCKKGQSGLRQANANSAAICPDQTLPGTEHE